MEREQGGTGLALGAWGAVQAGAAGVAIALGGALRDLTSAMAAAGALGPGLRSPVVGYSIVYQLEIVLLFIALIVLGPLVGRSRHPEFTTSNALNVATDSARRLMSLKNA